MIAAIVVILAAHWVADLPCQTTWMRMEKWHSWKALSAHALVYTTVMLIAVALFDIVSIRFQDRFPADPDVVIYALWRYWLLWAGLNGALHFVQDAITSRWTHKLWPLRPSTPDEYGGRQVYVHKGSGDVNHFFNVICGDQILHAATLLSTAAWWLP